MICAVCLEERERKDFYKVKHFEKVSKTQKLWCRTCQRDYISLKQEKEKKKQFELKKGLFTLEFN